MAQLLVTLHVYQWSGATFSLTSAALRIAACQIRPSVVSLLAYHG